MLRVRAMLWFAEQGQLISMASVLAMLPCRVLWRISSSEIPDDAAVTALHLGNNTKVRTAVSASSSDNTRQCMKDDEAMYQISKHQKLRL